jgi:Tfp pilus assembly protein PilF/4-amino-4-deoxy-L-arabinose transferase-like glycosyltransferase
VRATGIAVFLVAFALRAWHVVALRGSPLGGDVLLGDARAYDEWAQRIAAGDWLGGEVFYQAPLYPYFLATLYAIFGRSFELVRWVQAAVGAASCVLLAGAGRRMFGARAGTIAGLLLAAYPVAVVLDVRIDKSVLDLFLLSAASYLLGGQLARPRAPGMLATGACLGALGLVRENALLLVPALAGWTAWRARRRGRAALVAAAALVTGAALVLVPVAVRNRVVGGGFHLTTSQLGPNLWIGNNPDANGTYAPLLPARGSWRHEREDAIALAERALGRSLAPGEVSAYWLGRSLDYVRSEPVDWLELKARTLVLAASAVEIVDSEDVYTHFDRTPVLSALARVFHFGTLAPLAFVGAWLARGRRRALAPLLAMIAAYAASVVAFYVFARYRLPLVPMLVLLAAYGLVRGPRAGVRRAAPALAGALAVAVLCNWPTLPVDSMRAVTRLNLGIEQLEAGRTDRAITELERAVALDPGYALAHFTLGNALKVRGDLEGAIESYRAAVAIEPDHAQAWNNLGTTLAARGRLAQAIEAFAHASSADPSLPAAPFNLGRALAAAGRFDEAIASYERAIALDPSWVEALHNLALLLAERGRPDDAARRLERVLELDPRSIPAHLALAELRRRQAALASAARHYEAVIAIDPGHVPARRALAELGRSGGEIP